MSERVAVIWTDDYVAYDFGPAHPLKPVRVQLTVDLARACGLLELPTVTVVAPRPATRAELETIHSPAYIDAIERISAAPGDPYADHGWGIGSGDNPSFPRMHEASALVSGGAIVAAERIRSGDSDHVFVPAGGLHHAMPDRASGFCIYNDPALAIRALLDAGVERIVYVDVDVHHGDGVEVAFEADPRVMTISLHESGNFLFPGTGFARDIGRGEGEGTAVNVSLPPYTHDDAYREAFERVVPPLVESFKPEVLVTQLGCDTHVTDPLAHLALTTRSYRWLAGAFHELAHAHAGGRWLATGGGGYQIYTVVPRAWTIYFAELAEGELPDRIPASWLDLARSRGAEDLPTSFEDPRVALPDGRRLEATERMRAAVEETTGLVFPFHGLKASRS